MATLKPGPHEVLRPEKGAKGPPYVCSHADSTFEQACKAINCLTCDVHGGFVYSLRAVSVVCVVCCLAVSYDSSQVSLAVWEAVAAAAALAAMLVVRLWLIVRVLPALLAASPAVSPAC